MKYIQQREDGTLGKAVPALNESDHTCECCDSISHYKEVGGQYHDDVMCDKCQSLCSCKCHRPPPKED